MTRLCNDAAGLSATSFGVARNLSDGHLLTGKPTRRMPRADSARAAGAFPSGPALPFLAIRAGIAGRDMDHGRAFIDKRQFIVATSAVVETDNGILDQFAQQSAWAEIRRGLADDRWHGS